MSILAFGTDLMESLRMVKMLSGPETLFHMTLVNDPVVEMEITTNSLSPLVSNPLYLGRARVKRVFGRIFFRDVSAVDTRDDFIVPPPSVRVK